MTPPHADTEVFDKLPGDAEHRVHEFLRISEVCALRGVSTSWRMRTGEALQHKYRWDLSHVDGVDVEAHVWLEHLSKASINTRSLRVVRHWCTQFIGACQLFISSKQDYVNRTSSRMLSFGASHIKAINQLFPDRHRRERRQFG